MSEKLKKVLEEIQLGIRKNTYDIELDLEEYLSKDENGISFLEYLLKNNISIYYKDEEKFKKNMEIGCLYCKYGRSLFPFDFDEETLFSEVEGKLFIKFIIDHGKISQKIIKAVKNHIELVDILIASNEMFSLGYLSQELVNKLMTKYENGLYPIEKHLVNVRIYNYLIPVVNDAEKLIEICTRHEKFDYLQYANEIVLMSNFNENQTVLQFLLNEKNIIPRLLNNIPNNIDFVNYIRKNNLYEYLNVSSEDVMLLEIESNKTLLEELLEKGYTPKIKGMVWNEETIRILNKFDKLELLNEISVLDSIFVMPASEILNVDDEYNRTFLEYMLDNGYEPLKITFSITNKDIIKILYNKGYYNILGEKLREKELLMEIEPGIILIDKLLESNVSIKVDSSNSIELVKKIYDKNRFDLLAKADITVLLNNCDSVNTYFDFVLEGIKSRDIKYSLNEYRCSDELKAKFYILIAKHDMIKYVNELDEDDLLKEFNGKTLLQQLLDLNTDLTLNKILSNDVKSNLKISIILKSQGLTSENIDVIDDKTNYTKSYLDKIQSSLGIGPLYAEGDYLLKELENLFMHDGESDTELVAALVNGYRDALIVNYKTTIQELRSLVEIKTENKDVFFYIKEENSGYFSRATRSVHCDDTTISTLMHETGHALHYYLAESKIPEEYNGIVERIKKDPKTIKKVEEYSKKFNKLKKKIKLIAEKKYEEYFDLYLNKDGDEINDFLNKSKEEKKAEFKLLGIDDDVLDIILDNIFTPNEYMVHQKRLFIKENVDAILRSEFGAYISIGDIIDAIYDGDFNSGTLKNNEGKEIKSAYGHGLSYYYARPHGFDEMLANFCMILKSRDAAEVLDLLKSIVGEELYNMLCKFYYENIVNPNEIQLEDSKKI